MEKDITSKVNKEMEDSPCNFRKKEYHDRTDLSRFTYVCALTASRADTSASCGRYESDCEPQKCPMWKTYVLTKMVEENYREGE